VMSRYWGKNEYELDPFPEEPFSLTEDLHGTLELWPNWMVFESEWFNSRVIHSIGSSRYVPIIVSRAQPKSFKDFLKAYTRWGIGAIQLCPKYSLFTYIPFILILTFGGAAGMVIPVILGFLDRKLWVNLIFSVGPVAVFTIVYLYFSYASEVFQAKCVQWVATSNFLFSAMSGMFWPTALPLFFSFGFVLPFQAIWFASFAILKSFLELLGYEITKSVVNKLTKNCGLKDDNEYMRNFLTFLSLWPLNLYSVAHVLTYPEEWTPNPIPTLSKIFLAQSGIQAAIFAISCWTISKNGGTFSPAIVSLMISISYFLMMAPYFIFFFYLNKKKARFGVFEAKENKGLLFWFYDNYTKILFLVPFTWLTFIFSIAVFLYVIFGTLV